MLQNNEPEALEVRLVLEAINARYGYDFRDYAPETMRRRLYAVMTRTSVGNLGLLQHRILREPEFFGSIVDDLTIQVSEMFRDPSFYRAFREQVVPVLRTYPAIKIWHAGCANGEEVYASAILLMEEELLERTQIYATDMSVRAIEQAREGIYAAASADLFARNYVASGGKKNLRDYYAEAYGGIAVSDRLKRNIVFFQHDLVSDYALGEMQVVFCRNVLIYFNGTLRQRVLDVFADSVCRGGFLCLGHSEQVPASHAGIFGDFSRPERIYRCRGRA